MFWGDNLSTIEEIIRNSYNGLREYVENNDSICKLKSLNFSQGNVPDYSSNEIQLLYQLKYSYAYAYEYKCMYTMLFNQISHISIPFNILSIGCGTAIDAWSIYAALEAINKIHFWSYIRYIGIDKINWNGKIEGNNINIYQMDLSQFIQHNDIDYYNVIIFPKSISEIDEMSFLQFCHKICNTKFNNSKIYLLVNLRENNYYLNKDISRSNRIIESLKEAGFHANIGIGDYTYFIDEYKNKHISEIDKTFVYPEEIRRFIPNLYTKCNTYKKKGQSCYNDCKDILSRWPVTKLKILRFQVITLEKLTI